ncbi:hypothetical protein J6590_103340 [Homalodisca vitripennis]|nr:hypothetical protein J6590_103340 [Homalodisca vitripennis]
MEEDSVGCFYSIMGLECRAGPCSIQCVVGSEVRAKIPSLTLNLRANDLKVTAEPPRTVKQAGCLQGLHRGHPSKQLPLPYCLIRHPATDEMAEILTDMGVILGLKRLP